MEASYEELRAELARVCAEVHTRLQWRPVDWEIFHWRAGDVHHRCALVIGRMEHLVQRREAHAVAVAGWRAWLAALGASVLRVVGRSLLPSWSPWTGLAPPAVPQLVQRQ